jgi:hypothetical protein
MGMAGYVMFAIIELQRSNICSNFSYLPELFKVLWP